MTKEKIFKVKCKKCGKETTNKSGYCDNCLYCKSEETLNEHLGISEERVNFIADKLDKIISTDKFTVSDDINAIKDLKLTDIENIYAGYMMGLYFGENETKMEVIDKFSKFLNDISNFGEL